jgi:hypothetical protein
MIADVVIALLFGAWVVRDFLRCPRELGELLDELEVRSLELALRQDREHRARFGRWLFGRDRRASVRLGPGALERHEHAAAERAEILEAHPDAELGLPWPCNPGGPLVVNAACPRPHVNCPYSSECVGHTGRPCISMQGKGSQPNIMAIIARLSSELERPLDLEPRQLPGASRRRNVGLHVFSPVSGGVDRA